MELIGYARKSTEYQSLETQIAALGQAGCTKIFAETASGGDRKRTAFQECLAALNEGDALVLYHSNRLARDTYFSLEVLEKLKAMRVEIRSIMDPIDLSTPAGECMFTVSAAIATMERKQNSLLIKDRLARKKAQGVVLGRRRKIDLKDKTKLIHAVALHKQGLPVAYAAKELEISTHTYYRALAVAKEMGLYPEYIAPRTTQAYAVAYLLSVGRQSLVP